MIKVNSRQNESIDSLLRRFNTAVVQDGVLKELKDRSRYEKPSVKKRRKAIERKKELKNPVK
jgi:small subunit ribosomal protein S21